MARVPSPVEADVPNVLPETAPRVSAPQLRVAVSPGAFSVVGQAMQHAGAEIGEAGDKVFNEAVNIQNLKNDTDARDITNTFTNTLAQRQSEFETSGAAAGDPAALKKYLGDSQQFYEQTRNSIQNPIVRNRFENDSAFYVRNNVARASAYSNEQLRTVNKAAHVASIQQAGTDIRTHPDDQQAVENNIQQIADASTQNSKNAGLDPTNPRDLKIINQQILDDTSDGRRQQIEALIMKNPARAYQLQQEYEQHGLISDKDAARVRTEAFEGITRWSGESIVDRLRRGLTGRDADTPNPIAPVQHAAGNTGVGAGLIPERYQTPELAAAITRVSQANGIHPGALAAVIQEESGWDPMNTNRLGMYGLFQAAPQTAEYSKVKDASPAVQIDALGDRLNRIDFKGQLARAGIDLSKLTVAQQAAYLEASQFEEQAGIANLAAGRRATTTRQDPHLGTTDFNDMTSHFQSILGAEGSTPTTAAAKAPAPTTPPFTVTAASQSPSDLMKAVDAWAEHDAPGNDQVRLSYENALSKSLAQTEKQNRLSDQQNQNVIYSALLQARQSGQRVGSLEELMRNNPAVAQAVRALSVNDSKFAYELGQSITKNLNSVNATTPEQQGRYNYLRALAVENPEQFRQVKTLIEDLPLEWRDGLFKSQLDLEKEGAQPIKPSHAMTLLNPTTSKIWTSRTDPGYIQFEGDVMQQLEDYKTRTGKDMPDADIQTMGHRMLLESTTAPGRIFGTRQVPFYQATAPKVEADKIRADKGLWQRRGIPNPTDEEVDREYRQQQYNKFYGNQSVTGGASPSLQPKAVPTIRYTPAKPTVPASVQ